MSRTQIERLNAVYRRGALISAAFYGAIAILAVTVAFPALLRSPTATPALLAFVGVSSALAFAFAALSVRRQLRIRFSDRGILDMSATADPVVEWARVSSVDFRKGGIRLTIGDSKRFTLEMPIQPFAQQIQGLVCELVPSDAVGDGPA